MNRLVADHAGVRDAVITLPLTSIRLGSVAPSRDLALLLTCTDQFGQNVASQGREDGCQGAERTQAQLTPERAGCACSRGRPESRWAAAGVLVLLIAVASFVLISTRGVAVAMEAAERTAVVSDLSQDARFYAANAYASMSHLKELPIDELKIDRSFITRMADDLQSAILARSIVTLGHNLGVSVVAEGVEDETAQALLRDAGCDIAQGYYYYYARPMSVDELNAWRHARPAPG